MKTKTCISDKKPTFKEYEYFYKPFSQLCWNCHRVLNASCEWMQSFSPVDGWDALEDKTETRDTFFIFKCPKYQPIHPPRVIECYCCGKKFSSYMDNVFCSAECYASYKPALLTNKCERCGDTYQCKSTKRRFCTRCLYEMRRKNK